MGRLFGLAQHHVHPAHAAGAAASTATTSRAAPRGTSASPPATTPTATTAATATPKAAGGASPAALVSSLVARRVYFHNSGAPNPDNCAVLPLPAALGLSPTDGENNMEMCFHIEGTIPAATEFDILRTRASRTWQQVPNPMMGGAPTWSRLDGKPAGTNDDSHNDDECLRPTAANHQRIFVFDTPGWSGSLSPVGITSETGGPTVAASAVGYVWKDTFAEWVIARNRPLAVPWRVISQPTFTFWHTINSVGLVGGAWQRVDTPSGQHNEIALGSVNLATPIP